MQHALITPLSPVEQVAVLASGAMDVAARQQTGNAGTVTLHHGDEGSRTIMGPGAGPTGIAPWVGDTTPPGVPTGVSAGSGSGLILVSWGGGLEGGVPPDFDHVQILVDGADAGRLTAAGTLACGPYGLGTEHAVTAVAWDDAHGEDGGPAPNASPACSPLRVTVTGADVEPGRLGITVTKSDKEPQGSGVHTGDLWLRYTAGSGSTPALAGEWWWDGTKWVPIPVAIYLDQLAARGVQVDSAVIGLLSAGIIKSGTFVTPDGLVGLDASGFWVKDTSGGYALLANKDGIMVTGAFQTASTGRRILLSQRIDDQTGISTGVLEGISSNDEAAWFVEGSEDGSHYSFIAGAGQQIASFASTLDLSSGKHTTGVYGNRVVLSGDLIELNGVVYTPHINVPLDRWITFLPGFTDYVHRTRLDIAGGMCYMTIAVQGKIAVNQYTPVARISSVYPPEGQNVVCTLQYAHAAGAFIGSDTDPDPQVVQFMNHSDAVRTWGVAQFIFPYSGQLDW